MMIQSPNEKQEARIQNILEKGLETAVFNDVIFSNYDNYLIEPLAMTILLSLMFIITPIYIRDNRQKVNYLQYTSKLGRRIFTKKILSGLIATFIIVTLQLISFFALYSTNNTLMFLNSNINSVYNSLISWYDLTFIQYIGLTVAGIYALAFIFTLISMLVSSISQNYITVIGIQLPIALFAFIILLKHLLVRMTNIQQPKYFLGISYAILLLGSGIAITLKWKKESKGDILY